MANWRYFDHTKLHAYGIMRVSKGRAPAIGFKLAGGRPIHIQIYERLRSAILRRVLTAGARLPSTRALAEELGVSRTTVLTAYEQLLAEGYVEGRSGAGTRVAARLPDDLLNVAAERRPSRPARRSSETREVRDLSNRGRLMSRHKFGPELRLAQAGWRTAFRVALPALDRVPLDLWSRIVARHARRRIPAFLDYQNGKGFLPLRRAIASHIAVARGVRCNADQVLITAGAQSAIDLAVRMLLDPGDTALVENPSHLGFRGALNGAGVTCVPILVDGEGMLVSAKNPLPGNARLACVAPSNQFPLAVTMSLSRRLGLLGWAARTGAWILEDDYDSEFRFVGRPLESLQSLDPAGRVLYVGSFSKVLFPAIRLGYLVVPPNLVDAFVAARHFVDVHPPVLQQAALADFIAEGHFGRHLRRMRMLYAERGEALVAAARRHLSGLLDVQEPQAGMHTIGYLPAAADDQLVSTRASLVGVEARPLSVYGIGRVRPGLVLGFGTVSPREIEKGAQALAQAIDRGNIRFSGR